MDDKLLGKYLEYANTDEALAVLFAKKYIPEAKGHWVDIEACERYEISGDPLHFKIVECVLFKRKIKPQYPPKADFTVDGKFDDDAYYLAIRAITWETAHRDIDKQRGKGVVGDRYIVEGVRYNKNKGKYKTTPPWLNPQSRFHGDSPNRFSHRDRRAYEVEPEWVYKVKSVRKA
jgi:hypothetical protein